MKKIALMINKSKESTLKYANEAAELLYKNGCTVYIAEHFKDCFDSNEYMVFKPESQLFCDAEGVVVFGGDGTIMRTAHKTNLPILGVNLGRIGYTADLETSEIFMLKELATGNYTIENRMMLSFEIVENGLSTKHTVSGLNEIVLSKGGHSVMPEIELRCNGEEVGKYFADGLIAATPTGSTAYSLAAGGSIVDPGMECFCVTPICPQSFYAKPLIFSGNSVLEFRKGKRGHGKLILVCDGEYVTEIDDNARVLVKKSELGTKLIRIKKDNFYSVMRSKMTEI